MIFHLVQFSMRNLHIRIGQVLKYRLLTFLAHIFLCLIKLELVILQFTRCLTESSQ